MSTAVLFPDAEKVTIMWLRSAFLNRTEPFATDVTVWQRFPDADAPQPALPKIRIRRNGGLRLDLITEEARIDVQVWHRTDYLRSELARLTRALLHLAAGHVVDGVPVYYVIDFTGPFTAPDPADDATEIVQFSVDLRLRGTAA